MHIDADAWPGPSKKQFERRTSVAHRIADQLGDDEAQWLDYSGQGPPAEKPPGVGSGHSRGAGIGWQLEARRVPLAAFLI